MAKKSLIQRQLRRETLVHRYFEIRQRLKKDLKEANSFKKKIEIHTRLQKLPRDSSKTRLKNRCWKTGRARAVFRDFGLCRILVRQMANQGFFPGVRKSSW